MLDGEAKAARVEVGHVNGLLRKANMTSYPITVAIPALNAEATIAHAMQSVLEQVDAQGNPLAKVLVVNDGSTDGTAAAVESVAKAQSDPDRVQLVSHIENKGMLAARKTSMQHVDTPFVMFLDADDEYLPHALACMLEAQADTFDIVQCGTDVRYSGHVDPAERAFTEAFCSVPETEAFGDDIAHLVFRDRKTTWSLWGKLMRSTIVREAYLNLPDEYVNLGEDLCAFFVISCLAQSYRGIGSCKGYVYNIDAGSSGALRTSFDLPQFLTQCECIMPLHLVLSFLIRTQRAQALMPDYLTVRHEQVRAIADKLLNHMATDLQPAAFDVFANLWPLEEAVAALAEVGWERPADTYDAVAAANALQCPPAADGKLRTIGIYNYKMDIGGAEQVSADLANLWHSMGYKVVFLCDQPREACSYDLPTNVIWEQLPATSSIGPQSYLERADAISRAVRKHKIDALVHQQWYNPLMAWDLMVLKGLRVPTGVFVHSFHGTLFFVGNADEFDASRVLRYADALVVLSESDRNFWERFNPRVFVTNNRSTIAPGSVTRSRLNSRNVVWVGRLTPFDKQPEEAIEIMAKLVGAEEAAAQSEQGAKGDAELNAQPDAQPDAPQNTEPPAPHTTLTLVGPARWQSELAGLQHLAKARGLGNRVIFAGSVDDVTPYLQSASVFLMTSRIEGYPLALSEAMAVGLPCVMYELPYLTLVKGNAGVISVPQGDRAAAAAALAELLRSPEKRHSLGDAASARLIELEAFDYEELWTSVFAALAQGSVSREDYAATDTQWDQLLYSMKMGVEFARQPNLSFALKDAAYQTARRAWHRVKPLISSARNKSTNNPHAV